MHRHEVDRHWLAWLTPSAAGRARPEVHCRVSPASASELLAGWLAAGHPLIVARQDGIPSPGELRLGLALPPALGKHRLAFRVPSDEVGRVAPPPAFDSKAIDALPEPWSESLRRVLALAEPRLPAPRILGSAGMQVVTGLACMSPDSDLDLLFSPPDDGAARALCKALASLNEDRSVRIDGEIRNARGEAVAWRELASGARQLLVKTLDGARLVDRASFAAGFADERRCAA